MRTKQLAYYLVGTGVAAAIAGCGLSSPYIRVPTPDQRAELCGKADNECSIDAAMAYSRLIRATYRNILDTYARMRTGTGTALIGIGAAAMGFSVVKAHRDVFSTLGFAGATTYTFEKWFENPAREALFGQAIDALLCAESIVDKLRLPTTVRKEITDLKTRLAVEPREVQALSALLPTLIAKRSARDSDAAKAPTKKERDDASIDVEAITARISAIDSILEAHELALTAVANARASATQRLGIEEGAGRRLMQTVETIVRATDREGAKTVPDPGAAFQMIGDLPGLAGRFTPNADAIKTLLEANAQFQKQSKEDLIPSDALKDEVKSWDDAIRAARSALSRFQADARLLANLSAVAEGDVYAPLEQCRIAGLGPLALSPPDLRIAEKTAGTVALDVDGGKPPYSGSMPGLQGSGITILPPKYNESRFVLTLPNTLVNGRYTVEIRDAAQRKGAFVITVGTSDAGSSEQKPDATTAKPPSTKSPFDAFVGGKTSSIDGHAFVITAIEKIDDSTLVVWLDAEPNPNQRDKLPAELGAVMAPNKTTLLQAAGKASITLKN